MFLADGQSTRTPIQTSVVGGIATSILSDSKAESIHVSVTSTNIVLTPPSEVIVTFSGGSAVAITAPAAGATVSGTPTVTFTVNTNGTADAGTAKVSIDGATAVAASGAISPYTYTWNTTGQTNGSHTIQAQAAVNGVTSYSGMITVTVNNVNMPTFTWTTPAPGSTLSYATTVNASYIASRTSAV